jgi:hypothetical protein
VTLSMSEKIMALTLLNATRREYAAHDEYVASFAGTGYRPARCIHGRSLWVDHDIPCGYCEEGEGYFDYVRCASDAIADAKRRVSEHRIRRAAWQAIYAIDTEAPGLTELMGWVSAPLKVEEWV